MDVSSAAPVLTSALAQEIAGDTSEIIGFNVIITDRDGTVIGSGDRGRVGSFHEASLEVVRTRRSATHSAAQARVLQGVRPGITLPIVLGDTALGTVGITGSPSEVRRFGLVVKRQTEILLQEAVLLRSRLLRERAIEDVVRDVAYFDADVVDPDLIAYRAGELGYDLTAARVAVVIDVRAQPGRLALLQTIRATFAGAQDIVAAMPSDRFVALHRSAAADDLGALCHHVVDELHRRHGLTTAAGIGGPAHSVPELHDSYLDASTALRLGGMLGSHPVNAIDDLRIHQMLATLGQRPRARLVDALTTGLRKQNDWPVLSQTIVAWCETGFNLVSAAAALHIHRNTLVYRLNKIAQLTGKPFRDHRAALALYLACLADQLDDDR
jgi:carbohydrate diacid regulator